MLLENSPQTRADLEHTSERITLNKVPADLDDAQSRYDRKRGAIELAELLNQQANDYQRQDKLVQPTRSGLGRLTTTALNRNCRSCGQTVR